MKTLQKLKPFIASFLFGTSICRLIIGGGLDSYYYWFNSFVLVSSIVTLLDLIPDSKEESETE